jgi:hypothetical protein
MRKFSLLESKESVYDIIGLDKEDIIDICQDLVDYGWEMEIDEIYLSQTGRVYKSKSEAYEYYPGISIKLERHKHKGKEKDPKFWKGGIYLENDVKDLKDVYLTIDRLQNIVSPIPGVDVNWGFRTGLDEIFIRITLESQKSKSPLPKEKIRLRLEETLSNLRINGLDGYKITSWTSRDSAGIMDIEISPKRENLDEILKRAILNGDEIDKQYSKEERYSNLIELPRLINHILEEVSKNSSGVKITKCPEFEFLDTTNDISNISFKDEVILKIDSYTESLGFGNVKVGKKFLRDIYERVTIYKLVCKIKY